MTGAALYYLFTGDRKALGWAREALDALDAFERPHFCYITLVGRVDIDLQTASVTRALAAMRACFAGALDPETARRLDRIAVKRCLGPALEALRTRKYWWTECRHNWRSVMAGSFAMGGMAFADAFRDWRELIEYGLEGVLVVLEEGDRAGGWQEGPGYWEYGIGHCAEFASALKRFTGGRVDLFRHPYLKRAGDFRPAPGDLPAPCGGAQRHRRQGGEADHLPHRAGPDAADQRLSLHGEPAPVEGPRLRHRPAVRAQAAAGGPVDARRRSAGEVCRFDPQPGEDPAVAVRPGRRNFWPEGPTASVTGGR
jgi:hypothetical protein